jgi:hypothetical protein
VRFHACPPAALGARLPAALVRPAASLQDGWPCKGRGAACAPPVHAAWPQALRAHLLVPELHRLGHVEGGVSDRVDVLPQPAGGVLAPRALLRPQGRCRRQLRAPGQGRGPVPGPQRVVAVQQGLQRHGCGQQQGVGCVRCMSSHGFRLCSFAQSPQVPGHAHTGVGQPAAHPAGAVPHWRGTRMMPRKGPVPRGHPVPVPSKFARRDRTPASTLVAVGALTRAISESRDLRIRSAVSQGGSSKPSTAARTPYTG